MTITVQELIDQLAACPAEHRHKPVAAWLPGSLIDLEAVFRFSFEQNTVKIEGNVRDGSVICEHTDYIALATPR
jgi:hypothetical protein